MKRADQHPVLHSDNMEEDMNKPEQTGIVSSSEKEDPTPEWDAKPTMGALPVDTPGSSKHHSGWKSSPGEESHETSAATHKPTNGDKIIHTGSGPDPDHTTEL